MEFLDIPLTDDDFLKLLFRFSVNFIFLLLIVRFVYYRAGGKKEYLFSYFMLNILVFFICFTLKKFELGLGMALGLFAIFGILRYRTDPIPIKEMTYLFIVIGMAVINALFSKKISYLELLFTNLAIAGIATALEQSPMLNRERQKLIRYERIELIHRERMDELKADLEARTGLQITRIEVGDIDFLRDTAELEVTYIAPRFTTKS